MTEYLKTGWHVQLDNRRGKYDWRLMSRPWPVISVTVSDNTKGWLDDHASAQPDTVRLARYMPAEDFYKARFGMSRDARAIGRAWGQMIIDAGLSKEPYWRTDEWANDDVAIRDFNLGALDVLIPAGYRVGCINYSVGNPRQPPYEPDDGWLVQRPVLEEISDAGPGRALALCNLYALGCGRVADNDQSATLLRIKHAMDLCEVWGLDVWWAAPETFKDVPGWSKCRMSDEQRADEVFAINAVFQQMPKFIGGAGFSLDEISPDFYISDRVFDLVEAWAENKPLNLPRAGAPVPTPTPTPIPTPTPEPERVNLIVNPGFDGGDYRIDGNPDQQHVPNAWHPIWPEDHIEIDHDPRFRGPVARVYQFYTNREMALGQAVQVEPGALYRVIMRASGWCTTNPSEKYSASDSPAELRLRVEDSLVAVQPIVAGVSPEEFFELTGDVIPTSDTMLIQPGMKPEFPVFRTDLRIDYVEVVKIADAPKTWSRLTVDANLRSTPEYFKDLRNKITVLGARTRFNAGQESGDYAQVWINGCYLGWVATELIEPA